MDPRERGEVWYSDYWHERYIVLKKEPDELGDYITVRWLETGDVTRHQTPVGKDRRVMHVVEGAAPKEGWFIIRATGELVWGTQVGDVVHMDDSSVDWYAAEAFKWIGESL